MVTEPKPGTCPKEPRDAPEASAACDPSRHTWTGPGEEKKRAEQFSLDELQLIGYSASVWRGAGHAQGREPDGAAIQRSLIG